MMIVSGGSAGSSGLPSLPKQTNSYNRIRIKWHPRAGQTRIAVETRGLVRHDGEGDELLAADWYWKTLRSDDRDFVGGSCAPEPRSMRARPFDRGAMAAPETARKSEYARLRGNMLAADVRPSLYPDQAYEARLWIVAHQGRTDIPLDVTWSAGPLFPLSTVHRDEDPHFAIALNYWGSFLAQAVLRFEDGAEEYAYIYARLPQSYDEEQASAATRDGRV
jgi:hypothetical protein